MSENCIGGALPPPGIEWQIGKTEASILYVQNTEAFLESLPQAKFSFDIEAQHQLLRERVAKVKAGVVILGDSHDYERYFVAHETGEW